MTNVRVTLEDVYKYKEVLADLADTPEKMQELQNALDAYELQKQGVALKRGEQLGGWLNNVLGGLVGGVLTPVKGLLSSNKKTVVESGVKPSDNEKDKRKTTATYVAIGVGALVVVAVLVLVLFKKK